MAKRACQVKARADRHWYVLNRLTTCPLLVGRDEKQQNTNDRKHYGQNVTQNRLKTIR